MLKHIISIICIYLQICATSLFAQTSAEVDSILINKILKSENFHLYINEANLLTNLYKKAIQSLSKSDFKDIQKRSLKGGYYYDAVLDSIENLYKNDRKAYVEHIKREALKKSESIENKMLKLPPEKKQKIEDSSYKVMANEYQKDSLYMRKYLKINPQKVQNHMNKAYTYMTEILDDLLLDGTIKSPIRVNNLLVSLFTKYKISQINKNEDKCDKKYQQDNLEFVLSLANSCHSEHFLKTVPYKAFISHIGYIHACLLRDSENYRLCKENDTP